MKMLIHIRRMNNKNNEFYDNSYYSEELIPDSKKIY
jgi:hypothetical protein